MSQAETKPDVPKGDDPQPSQASKQARPDTLNDSSMDEETLLNVQFYYRKHLFELTFPSNSTVNDLFGEVEQYCQIPPSNAKFLVPKGPLLKGNGDKLGMPLVELEGKKLTLLGSSVEEVHAVHEMADMLARRNEALLAHRPKVVHPRQTYASVGELDKYTFTKVKPLAGLPNPKRSQDLLLRLKNDPGVIAAMRKHKFIVALLTEMEPLSNMQSNHEGTTRLLGLNRNKGEVIELRLRTDAYDGYRDYKTIRKTLCHELAHNVHGPHDRQFWDLCHQIERQVEVGDYTSRGHTLGESSAYAVSGQAEGEADHVDEGGWIGGEFRLGGDSNHTSSGLSRREILASAATERMRQQNEAEQHEKPEGKASPKQEPHNPSPDNDA